MDIWQKTFNKDNGPVTDSWVKMFHPAKAKTKITLPVKETLSEKQCEAALTIFGSLPGIEKQCEGVIR